MSQTKYRFAIVAAVVVATLPARSLVAQFGAHTFDSSNQGWAIVGSNTDYGPPTLGLPGTVPALWDNRGNPGGALALGDHYYSTWISAPAAFLGNQSSMYGQSFSYDIFIRYSDQTSVPYPTAAIRGGGVTLLYTIATPPLFSWQRRVVTFNPDLWTVNEGIGSPNPGVGATAEQMQTVLGSLDGLYLLTEWRTGPDDTSVDNIGIGFEFGGQGDYNHDGVVDSADFVMWRKQLNSVFSQTDYSIWRNHFAESGGGGSSFSGVPEPASAVVLLTAFASLGATRLASRI